MCVPQVSFVSGSGAASSPGDAPAEAGERIAFNYGRELFVYPYKGLSHQWNNLFSSRFHPRSEKSCWPDKTHWQESLQRNLSHLPRLRTAGLPSQWECNEKCYFKRGEHSTHSTHFQSEVIPLLVGFSGGQIQLIDPARKELSRWVLLIIQMCGVVGRWAVKMPVKP